MGLRDQSGGGERSSGRSVVRERQRECTGPSSKRRPIRQVTRWSNSNESSTASVAFSTDPPDRVPKRAESVTQALGLKCYLDNRSDKLAIASAPRSIAPANLAIASAPRSTEPAKLAIASAPRPIAPSGGRAPPVCSSFDRVRRSGGPNCVQSRPRRRAGAEAAQDCRLHETKDYESALRPPARSPCSNTRCSARSLSRRRAPARPESRCCWWRLRR